MSVEGRSAFRLHHERRPKSSCFAAGLQIEFLEMYQIAPKWEEYLIPH